MGKGSWAERTGTVLYGTTTLLSVPIFVLSVIVTAWMTGLSASNKHAVQDALGNRNLIVAGACGISGSVGWIVGTILHCHFMFGIASNLMKSIHWATLTELSLIHCSTSAREVYDVFCRSPNLIKCAIEVSMTTHTQSLPALQLFQLEELKLYERVGFPFHLQVPKLRYFLYEGAPRSELGDVNSMQTRGRLNLRKFFSQQVKNLTSLVLGLDTLTEDTLLEVLSLVPSIKHLAFRTTNVTARNDAGEGLIPTMTITHDFLENLTPVESDDLMVAFLCPQLENFECEEWVGFSDAALARLITTRRDPRFKGGTLRKIVVKFNRFRFINLHEQLKELINEGVELDICYYVGRRQPFSPWSGMRRK